MKTSRTILIAAALLLAGSTSSRLHAADENWPQFLGPGVRAVAANANLPDRWSATENVAWKTEIAGRGWSSPIVRGNRVFLTTVADQSDKGKPQSPQKGFFMGGKPPAGEKDVLQWIVLCLDLHSGKILWQKTVHEGTPPEPSHPKNSYASETPVTDGDHVYAYFGNVGVFCLDFGGNLVWSKKIEPHKTRFGWGTASSPLLHLDRLYIVNDNEDKSYMVAVDKKTGDQVWRVDRDEKSNWSTPAVWSDGQRTEIVTAGTGKVRAYDLDGKLLWWLRGMSGITVATPYADGGLLYVSSGFVRDKDRPFYAIRPGAGGDISLKPGETSNASIAWSRPTAAPYIPTTLVYDKRLYVLYDRATFSAFDSQTGKPLYEQQKLPERKNITSSPWACNGRVFCLNEDGTTFVIRAGDKFEVLGTNHLANDEMCLASPAIADDRLLIRTLKQLYCIRKR